MRIFSAPGAGNISNNRQSNGAMTTISIGGQTLSGVMMIEESQGAQAARIQVDATLDGKLHAIGSTTGVGAYSAVFYDGPICGDKQESVMKKYLGLKSLKDREATIYLYHNPPSGPASSTPTAKFKGLLNNMAVSTVEENGLVYIRVGLGLLGFWHE